MGSDKALISYHGMSQREFLFETLKTVCDEVYTSCLAGQEVPEKLNPLRDQFNIQGPMNGVLTALNKSPDRAWIIVAVDMPHISATTFHELISNRSNEKVATCFFNEAERFPEPLITLWEPKALPLLMKFWRAGRVSPRDFLKENDVQLILPSDRRVLLNINTD